MDSERSRRSTQYLSSSIWRASAWTWPAMIFIRRCACCWVSGVMCGSNRVPPYPMSTRDLRQPLAPHRLEVVAASTMPAMKVFLIVLGAFLFLIGGACAAGGAVALAVVGTDGWVQSGTDEVDVRGAALVSGTEEI